MTEKNKKEWKRDDIEPYKEGNYQSDAGIVTTPTGKEALQISTSRKYSEQYTRRHTGLWIPKEINVNKWFSWLVEGIKKLVQRRWKQELDPAQEVEQYKEEIRRLAEQLAIAENRRKVAEEKVKQRDGEIRYARQLIDKLDTYEKAFIQFKDEVKRQKDEAARDESILKKILLENRWLLGLDCVVLAKEKSIDIQASIDAHIQTNLGQDKIFEFKSPALSPFKRKTNNSRLEITMDFAEGLNQLVQYLKKTDYLATQNTESGYGVQKAIGRLVIGFQLDDSQIELIKEWNHHLRPNIEIKTYDDLITSASNQLENIRYARENSVLGKKEA